MFFEKIKLNSCSERAYTLYCVAANLTLGTKHIIMSDRFALKCRANLKARLREKICATLANLFEDKIVCADGGRKLCF